MKSIIAMSMILIACGHMPEHKKPEIDQEFVGYVEEFLNTCDYYDIKSCRILYDYSLTSVKWVDQLSMAESKNTIAVCVRTNDTHGAYKIHIEVLRKIEKYNNIKKRTLLYHELGHCLLDLNHSASGIMAPELTDYKSEEDLDIAIDYMFTHVGHK